MKIAVVAGSNRKDSTSTTLCRYIVKELEGLGCTAILFDLHAKPLPFYSPDEEIRDANVVELLHTLREADGIVLATSEYHGSLTGVLKNALDFAGFDQFDGKVVLSVSSAGGAVGVSSLQHLQTIVRNVHGINCPEWISIGGAQREFTAEGEPKDPKTKERVLRTLSYFTKMIGAFRG